MSYPSPPFGERGCKINLRGRRLLVVGLAREGTALASYLASQGARVIATDVKPPKAFGDELVPLSEAGVELVLGEHPPSLLDDCEVMFVSPGVPFNASFLNEARARGVPLSTESRLFCQLCPAPIAAITGSSGKTTTTTLVGEMLKADRTSLLKATGAVSDKTVWVGGNIGQPLITCLDQIQPDDNVVMELSSFQLEYFHPSANDHVADCDPMWLPLLAGWSPSVAAILNITPNHLDRHLSMEDYIHAKRALVAYRLPGDLAVMGLDNDVTRAMGQQLPGRVHWFSQAPSGFDLSPAGAGAYLSGTGHTALVMLRDESNTEEFVCHTRDIQLRGDHNVSNVLAACAITSALGGSIKAMRQAASTFTGVEHRLELVGEVKGVHYYNDSIATSPERLVAALKSFDEPLVLLAGGRDKHLPWDEAAQLMLERTRHVILFGEAVELIARALEAASRQDLSTTRQRQLAHPPQLHRCVTMEDAVAVASYVAHPGDAVLLSPGCTSFDAFKDFAERGERFRELVRKMQHETRNSEPGTRNMKLGTRNSKP